MKQDEELYNAMSAGLLRTEDALTQLGVPHWKMAMVTYDPTNPKAYMVVGSPGEEKVQQKIAAAINPEDADRPPDYVAPHSAESCPHLRISASPTEVPYCADCGKKFGGENPSDALPQEIQIAVLEGEMELHHDEIGWWAKELDFWRCKYLKEHPELDNWEYVRNARKNEEERGF